MEDFFENELIRRFEEMIENHEEFYFETESLEAITIHYLEIGDIAYAELAVNYGQKLHPGSLEIKTKKLEVLLELEQYSEAKSIIEELHLSSLEDTDFLICCARYYSNLGHSKRAIGYCKKALDLGEEKNFLHNFIADEYLNLEDPFSAIKHYKEALKVDPNDEYAIEKIVSCYSLTKKKKKAIEFLNSYLDQFPFSETAWFEYGQFFFNQKDYREAIKGFDYLLAINDSATGAYSNKAFAYEALKDWKKAIETYKAMLPLEQTKAFTFYKIGLCYKELGDSANAISGFQKSLREDPQFYLSMMELSRIYESVGNTKEALCYAKEATELNIGSLEYHKRLVYLYVESGSYEESLPYLEKLVRDESERFYNWYVYAEVLIILGKFHKAIEVLTEAIKTHNRAELFYQLSNSYFSMKNEEDGSRALEIALKLDPKILEDMQEKYPFIKEKKQKKER
ncbi:MAG: tetratricopeptide repeat protein [Bergeyella sp.]|nr:tetratricopeptide repeat protein [Bergeyella sp.]